MIDLFAERVEQAPDLLIRLDDGTDVPARDALQQVRNDVAQAEADSRGFVAAITCFLSRG